MLLGTLETRNFEFQAFGKTRAEVMSLLRTATMEHSRQFRCDPQYFVVLLATEDNIRWLDFRLGSAYRDGEQIKP